MFLEGGGVIKGDVDTWGFNTESDQGGGSRFGGKAKTGPNRSMVKFGKGKVMWLSTLNSTRAQSTGRGEWNT
jgi:hypothetical protein